MRTRREVLGCLLLAACTGTVARPDPDEPDELDAAAADPDPDATAGSPLDAAACTMTVVLYDVYAMALYFDGGLGPRTGIIRVSDVAAAVELPLEFWHGHGGQQHRFVVTPAHFAALKRRERVMIETTEVDGHRHMLFVDPVDPQWRVEGAGPQTIPAC